MAKKQLKLGMMSALAAHTGGSLRGKYLANALQHYAAVNYFSPNPQRGIWNFFLFIPRDILRSFYKKFDFFIVLKPFPSACIPAFFNRLCTGSKVIIDVDDLDHSYRTGIIAKAIEATQRILVRRADYVTVLKNEDLLSYITRQWKIPSEKIIPLEQGVDVELFKPSTSHANSSKKTICFTGHLGHTAGVEVTTLLRIFRKLPHQHVQFLIAGGGPQLDSFKAYAQQMQLPVEFTGFLENTKFPVIIQQADICVCYYADRACNYYRNSMKMREYLSMGKLVVSTDVGDLKRFRRYAIQTPPNEEAFLQGLQQALEKKEAPEEAARRREYIIKHFSWSAILKEFVQKLQQLRRIQQ